MRRLMTFLAAGLTAALSIAGVWLWLGSRPSAAPETLVPYVVGTAPIEDTLIATGVVKPALTLDVRAAVSGLVEAVLVSEGETVRRGQVLARLASALPQSALDEAEANLRQAQLQDEATALEIDETGLELKRRAHARITALHGRGLVSRDDLERSALDLRQAERALERSRRSRHSSYARVEEARAAVARARALLDQTSIRAPLDAVVLRRHVDVGSGVSAVGQSAAGGTVLMTLGDSRRSAFYARVTAADAARLTAGLVARIRLDTGPQGALEGAVQSISTAGDLDASTGLSSFPIVVALTEAPNRWVNLPARAEIVLGREQAAVVVPNGCIWTDAEGQAYARIDTIEGPARRNVDLGAIQPERLEIRRGLVPGETIVCR